jgi:hypothetical protein
VISGIFVLEMVIKIIVMGFIKGPETYLKDSFNKLDFIIVLISIITWILEYLSLNSISFLRGFRALRALRPLRMVSKNQGMKLVVDSLLKAIPSLVNVMMISLLFYIIFGILSIQLFKGAFGYCNDLEM